MFHMLLMLQISDIVILFKMMEALCGEVCGCRRFRDKTPRNAVRLEVVSPGRSCHPTFAMSGALAWQVKQILIKKVLLVLGEIARELPGISPSCGVCSAPFSLCLFIITYLSLNSV